KADRTVSPPGHGPYRFDPDIDLVFERRHALPGHANGMAFEALDADGSVLLRREYYSIGGGFVVTGEEIGRLGEKRDEEFAAVPYPFASGRQMLEMSAASGLSIAAMKRVNE